MVNCVVLTADGTRAVTGDASGLVRVWDTEIGALCQPVLHGHDAGITTLAVDCSQVASGDSRSPRATLCLASRCTKGTRLLWSWPSDDPVMSSSEISFEEPLQLSFHGEFDFAETSRWREKRCRYDDMPDTFTMRASTEATSPGCVVRRDATFRVFEVVPFFFATRRMRMCPSRWARLRHPVSDCTCV
jgi:WD40 repeat protein